MTETLEARRLNVSLPSGARLSFSVPEGVTTSDALADVWKMERQVILGWSLKQRMIDGPVRPFTYRRAGDDLVKVRTPLVRLWRSRLAYAAVTAWSYVEMWARVFWRATFARAQTQHELRQTRTALEGAGLAKERGE